MLKSTNLKRMLALILTLIMVVGVLPISALADYETTSDTDISIDISNELSALSPDSQIPGVGRGTANGFDPDAPNNVFPEAPPAQAPGASGTSDGAGLHTSGILGAGAEIGQVFVRIEDPTPTPQGESWPEARGLMHEGWVNLYSSDSMMTIIARLAAERGWTVQGADQNFIQDIDGLFTMSRGPASGWMGTVNDWFVYEGFNDISAANGFIRDGFVVTASFSLNFGEDLGGTWGNNIKTLRALSADVGAISPEFSANIKEYILELSEDITQIIVTPTAYNRNFQVRATVGGVEFPRTQAIPVVNGTVITITVGDPSWPTMNNADNVPAEVYTITVSAPGGNQPPEPPVYANGWFTIHNPDGQLRARLDEALETELGQTTIDYSVVRNLRVTGKMHVDDFVLASMARSLFFGTGSGVTQRALLSAMVELDLSGVTEITGVRTGIANVPDAIPAQSFRWLVSLERFRLPLGIRFSGNLARDNERLTTLAFGNQPFTEGVFDFRGIEVFNDQFVIPASGGTFHFANTRPHTVIFPESVGAESQIRPNFFDGSHTLREVHFYSETAPRIGANAFRPANAASAILPVAVVPNNAEGGYQLPDDFSVHFSRVVSRHGLTIDRAAINSLISQASALNQSDFTVETWQAFQQALTNAVTVNNASFSTQEEIDEAATLLSDAIYALEVRPENATLIDVPKGTVVGAFRKGNMHFTAFQSFPMSLDAELSSESRDVWRASIPLGAAFHIEAYTPGQTAKLARRMSALTAHGTTITLDPTPLSEWTPGRGDASHNANVYTNVGDSGTLNLQTGQSFNLDTFRVWQAMDGHTLNYFIEPEFIFEVFGSSVDIEPIGSPGRQQLRISAISSGVSVIKVTFGPIEYMRTNGSRLFFDAIDERNTVSIVVNVDGGSDFNTGITARNDFDVWYFDNEIGSREFTFTPAQGSAVRVHSPLNSAVWGAAWSPSSPNPDGSFTVLLTEGRNIIEITNGGSVRHHIIHALGAYVSVVNTTNPGQPFAIGDNAEIRISGLSEPIEKLAGIYNPGFSGGWGAGDMRARLQFLNTSGDVFESNFGVQYSTLTTTFTVNYRLTDKNQNILNGHIFAGSMGSHVGAHRSIPPGGVSNNFTAVDIGPYAFGSLPQIVLPLAVQENVDKTELNAIIALAQAREEANYAPATWTLFASALANAIAVRNNSGATQENVSAAVSALSAAIGALVERPIAGTPLDDVRNNALVWIQNDVELIGGPIIHPVRGEWSVLAQARAGRIHLTGFRQSYLDTLRAHASQRAAASPSGTPTPVRLDNNRPTENQRVVLALTSLGIDASSWEGFDFVAPLADTAWVISQGRNSTAYALIALNTNNYLLGAANDPRTVLVSELLGSQNANGSWSIHTDTPQSHDITAMIIQALAPYYSNAAVRSAVDRAFDWLSSEQTPTGRINNDSQAVSQTIIALTAFGIDPAQDQRFIKNGYSLTDALLSFKITYGADAGAFGHMNTNQANAMSTDQAALALIALYRLQNNHAGLYDMSYLFTDEPAPIEVDRTALDAAIANVPALQGGFTNDSWNSLQAAFEAALAVRMNPDATQDQVNQATASLNAAINALIEAETGQPGGGQPGGGQPQMPHTITVTFSLFGATQHDGAPSYIWRTNSSAFRAWIPARTFTFESTSVTVFDVFTRAIQEAGMQAQITARNNYVASVLGPNGWLGEFDNGPQSGWMYMINGVHVNLGLGEQFLEDGDVILWHFTDNFTLEAWAADGGFVPPPVLEEEEEEDEELEQELIELADLAIALADFQNWVNPFDDVSVDNWFYESVRFVSLLGLMSGTEYGFEPDRNLSRAMLVTVLARAAGVDTTGGETWYSDAADWAVSLGITDGSNLGDDITREQLVTMLFRFANALGLDTGARADLTGYEDLEQVSAWAVDSMQWAAAIGLIFGRTDSEISPDGTATRAETATILMRFMTIFELVDTYAEGAAEADEDISEDAAEAHADELSPGAYITEETEENQNA